MYRSCSSLSRLLIYPILTLFSSFLPLLSCDKTSVKLKPKLNMSSGHWNSNIRTLPRQQMVWLLAMGPAEATGATSPMSVSRMRDPMAARLPLWLGATCQWLVQGMLVFSCQKSFQGTVTGWYFCRGNCLYFRTLPYIHSTCSSAFVRMIKSEQRKCIENIKSVCLV